MSCEEEEDDDEDEDRKQEKVTKNALLSPGRIRVDHYDPFFLFFQLKSVFLRVKLRIGAKR